MAAIVAGGSLGILQGSAALLGSAGQLGSAAHGRAGERVYLNAVTGNLVIQGQDEVLIGRGPDSAFLRTYNSQGLFNHEDNGDNWRLNFHRRVYGVTGAVNAAGSTITRVDADGAEAVYTYDATRGKYLTTEGGGAYDTLSHAADTWTWTDGDAGVTETYFGANGRLSAVIDESGNAIAFTYKQDGSGLLETVQTASGEITHLEYAGTNLTQIRTMKSDGATLVPFVRTSYAYDTFNRLTSVTTDLTPESTTDSKTYVTSYTYDGTSKRVASMTQSDGTSLAFAYVQVGADWRVSQITQNVDGAQRVTRVSYNTTNRTTTVTDPLGRATVLAYDTSNRLSRITQPAVDGVSQQVSYAYDAAGNVTSVTDAKGNAVVYGYDAVSAFASSTGETWTLKGTATIDSSGGQRALSLSGADAYAATPDGAALDITGDIDLRARIAPNDWTPATGMNVIAKMVTGGVSYRMAVSPIGVIYFGASANGTSETTAEISATLGFADGSAHWIRATYDVDNGAGGRTVSFYKSEDGVAWTLLNSVVRSGPSVIAATGSPLEIGSRENGVTERFTGNVYYAEVRNGIDGAVVAKFDPLNAGSLTDGNRAYERDAAGNVVERIFGTKNELLAQTQYKVADPDGAGSGQPSSAVTTRYVYDTNTRLRFTVSAAGSVTEHRYNGFGQRVATIEYTGKAYDLVGLTPASVLAETQLTAWLPADRSASVRTDYAYDFRGQVASKTTHAALDAAGNGIAAGQSVTQFVYDQAGRLLQTLDARGFQTSSVYDGLGRVLATTDALGRLTLTDYQDPLRATKVTLANGLERTSTYSAAGELVSLIESAGGPTLGETKYFYDANGRLRRTEDPTGIETHVLYDEAGRKVAEIVGNEATEFRYDANNNLTRTIRYANAVSATITDTSTLAAIRPAPHANDRGTWAVYDAANRLVREIDGEGYVTDYVYDGVGVRTQETRYATKVGDRALTLSGANGNYATTPDSAALDITGDIDVRAKVAANDWTPGTEQTIVAKYNTGGQRSWEMLLRQDGRLGFRQSVDGGITTNFLDVSSTVVIGAVDGSARWLRATLDVNNDAGGRTIRLYTSDDGVSWSQLGAPVTVATAANTFVSTAPLTVGNFDGGTRPFAGRIYYAELRNGDGSIAAKFDPLDAAVSKAAASPTGFAAATGELWTLVGTAKIDAGGGVQAVALPGTNGSFASTPDSALNSITGDLDLRARIDPANWAGSTYQEIICKSSGPGGNSYSLRIEASTGGKLFYEWSPTGGAFSHNVLSAAVPASSGTPVWVRVTHDVDNGAGGNDVAFYTSADGVTWTQLGGTVTWPGSTSIFDSASALTVGARANGLLPLTGRVYYAEVRNGIGGTVVAKFDPARDAGGASSFQSSTGEVWTLQGTAAIAAAGGVDRVTRHFHDADSRLRATLDAEGYLLEYRYDKAGQLLETIAYATATSPALRAAGTLAQLRPAETAADIHTHRRYNARGQLVREIDGEGFLTEVVYDAAGNKTQEIRYASKVTDRALNLPGTAGHYATTPDSPANSITGDIDLRAKVAADDWTPASIDTLIAKRGTAPNSYQLRIATDGRLNIVWYTDGTNFVNVNSTQVIGAANGTAKWLRATLDVDNGAGGYDVKFYTSDQGVVWTQLGTTISGSGTTSIADGGNSVDIGSVGGTGQLFAGKVYYAEVRDGIDGVVAVRFDPALDVGALGASSFSSATTGEAWSLIGAAKLDALGSERALSLPNTAGSYASTPHSALNSVTGDLDIRARVTMNDWNPGGGTEDGFVGKWGDASNQRSFVFANQGDGQRLQLRISRDGVEHLHINSAAGQGTVRADGETWWLRVTRVAATGIVRFYESRDGVAWTQVGGDVGSPAGNLYSSTAQLTVGAGVDNGQLWPGKLHRAELRNGIDGSVVAKFDPSLDAVAGASSFTSSTGEVWTAAGAARIDAIGSEPALSLSGAGDTLASTPDSAALDITGDIDIRARVAADDWTPAAEQTIAAKYRPAGNQRAWEMVLRQNGTLLLRQSVDGTSTNNFLSASSAVAVGAADGSAKWVRATLAVDNGAGGRTVRFYTSEDGVTWTQLGTDVVVAMAANTFNSSAPLTVGNFDTGSGSRPFAGKIFYAEVRNSIGGAVVARFAPSFDATSGASSFTSATGEVWTLVGVTSIAPVSSASALVSTYAYDALNRISRETNPEGTATQYTYDEVGNLIKRVKAVNTADVRTLNAQYDKQGRLTAELSGNGSALITPSSTQVDIDNAWALHAIRHTYDAAGRRTSTTDALGNRTLFYYDSEGRLRYTVNALGEVSANTRNNFGEVKQTTGHSVRIAAATLATLSGGRIDTALNTLFAGLAVPAADSSVSYAYDANGNLRQVTDALGFVETRTYNAFGEVVGSSEQLGGGQALDHTYAYDRRGQLTHTFWDPAGIHTTEVKQYDAFGRAVQITNGRNGGVSTFTYDKLGQVVATRDPLNALRSTSYDAFGRVLTQIDALGNATTFAYDIRNRSVTTTTPEGVKVTTLSNRHGEKVSVTDGTGNTTSYQYDRNGNLTQVDAPGPGAAASSYDRADRLIESVDAAGTRTTYSYDAASRVLTRVVDPGGLALTTSHVYDAKGQAVSAFDANGVETRTAFDLRGQVVAVTVDPTGLNLRTTYTYDGRGKTLTVTEGAGTSVASTAQYVYDKLGRLIAERVDPTGLNLTTSYAYDKNDNVLSRTDAGGNVTRYLYDIADRRIFEIDALRHVSQTDYDANGNVVRTARHANPIVLPADVTSEAAVRAVVVSANGGFVDANAQVTRHVYDGDNRERFEIDAAGFVKETRYDALGRVAETFSYAAPLNVGAVLLAAGYTQAQIQGLSGAQLWALVPPVLGANAISSGIVPDAARDRRTSMQYDARGQLVRLVDAEGYFTDFVYDNVGNKTQEIRHAAKLTERALSLSGASGGYASTPDSAANSITGDIDIRVKVALDDWTGTGVANTFVAKRPPGSTNLGFTFRTDLTSGRLVFFHTPDGTSGSNITDISSAEVSFADGATGWVRVTKDMDDGAGNRITKFYTSTDGIAWTQLGTTITVAGASSIFDSTAALEIGSQQSGTAHLVDGKIFYAEVRNGIGGSVVAKFDPAGDVGPGAVTSFSSATGEAWTVNGTATLSAGAQVRRSVYDAAGRLRYSIDAEGYVTERRFDALGQEIRRIRYADPVSVGASATLASVAALLPAAVPASAVQEEARYDKDGRLFETVDGIGVVTRNLYNAAGQKTDVIRAYGTAAAVTTHYAFDAAGRVVEETHAFGSAQATTTRYVLNALGERVKVTDPRGNAGYFYFGANNKVRFHVDPLGYVTEYRYDALGNVTDEVRYVNLLSGTYNEATTGDVVAQRVAAAANGAADRQTTKAYDRLGQLTAVTHYGTSTNYTEAFVYDAFGNKTQYTDKTGAIFNYEYNTRGLVTREISPPTEVADVSPSTRLTKAFEYDAFGNRTRMLEAFGLPQQRETRYAYDRRGLETRVEAPSFSVFDPVNRTSSVRTPVTEKTYDAAGNVVMEIAPDGGRVLNYYDALSRKVASVDADNALREFEYDPAGNLIRERTYDTRLTGPLSWQVRPLAVNPRSFAASTGETWTLQGAAALSTTADRALVLNGAAGNFASAANSANNDSALRFTEANQSVRVVNPQGMPTSAMSVEAWIKPDSFFNWADVVRWKWGTAGSWVMCTDANAGAGFGLHDGGSGQFVAWSGTPLAAGQLYHLVGTYDGSTVRFFVNGVQVGSTANVALTLNNTAGTLDLPQDMLGTVDGVRLYNRALSATEVSQHYSGTFANEAGLVGRWDFEQGSGSVALDGSGKGNHATLVNAPTWVSGIGNSKGGVVGDIDLRVEVALNDWTPAKRNALVAKFHDGVQKSFILFVLPDGRLDLVYSTDGLNAFDRVSTVATGFADGARRWIRATFDVNDGAGRNVARFYTSVDGTTWTQLGADVVTAGTTSLFDSSAKLTIGAFRDNGGDDGHGNVANGKIFYAEVRNGIDGAVATRFDPLEADPYREMRYTYNASNLRIGSETRVETQFSYERLLANLPGYYDAAVRTATHYNANGDVIKTADGNGNSAYQFYDALGNRVLQVDPLGFVVRWEYNSYGQVAVETRYATTLPGATLASLAAATIPALAAWNPQSLIATIPAHANDRITAYVYDRLGRVTIERQIDVAYASVNGGNGQLSEHVANLETRFEYDGNDRLTAVILPGAHGRTDYVYDALGRRTRERKPEFQAFNGRGQDLVTTRELTRWTYDAHGNVALQTQVALADNDAENRTTRYTYDSAGRLRTQVGAEGATTSFDYDIAGNVLRRSRQVTEVDGAVHTYHTYYTYDRLNREISHKDSDQQGTSEVVGETRDTRYNAHGDIEAKGTNSQYQEQYKYDRLGRLFFTNNGNGTPRLYVYDSNGNATLEVQAVDRDLGTVARPAQVKWLSPAEVQMTVSRYDARNQITEVFQPPMEFADLGTTVSVVPQSGAPGAPAETLTNLAQYQVNSNQLGWVSGQTQQGGAGSPPRVLSDPQPVITGHGYGALPPPTTTPANLPVPLGGDGLTAGTVVRDPVVSNPVIVISADGLTKTVTEHVEKTTVITAISVQPDNSVLRTITTRTDQIHRKTYFTREVTQTHGAGDTLETIWALVKRDEVDVDRRIEVQNHRIVHERTIDVTASYVGAPASRQGILSYSPPGYVSVSVQHEYQPNGEGGYELTGFMYVHVTVPAINYYGTGPVTVTETWNNGSSVVPHVFSGAQTVTTRIRYDGHGINVYKGPHHLASIGMNRDQTSAGTSISGGASVVSISNQNSTADTVRLIRKSNGQSWTTGKVSYEGATEFNFFTDLAAGEEYEYEVFVGGTTGTLLNRVSGRIGDTHNNQYSLQSDELVVEKVQQLDTLTDLYHYEADTPASRQQNNYLQRLVQLLSVGSTHPNIIHRRQSYNAFGEIVAEIDGRNNRTDLAYNDLGKLIQKQDPTTDVHGETGTPTRERPTTRYYYNELGELVGTQDAVSNLKPTGERYISTRKLVNGRVEREFDAFGYSRSFQYDRLGNQRLEINQLGLQIESQYDRNGRLTRSIRYNEQGAQHSYDAFQYDQAGNRIKHTNALGASETYRFDGQGRIRRHTSFAGRHTHYDYAYLAGIGGIGGYEKRTRTAGITSEGTPVEDLVIDHHDYFGKIHWHRDLGGHAYVYSYNRAGWLKEQTGSTGGDGRNAQHIVYEYFQNGYLKSVYDTGIGSFSSFQYDLNGNRTLEAYAQVPFGAAPGEVNAYQLAVAEYDELNRVKRVHDDARFEIQYTYDANGNRRSIQTTYFDLLTNAPDQEQKFYYKYDRMNRFVTTMGQRDAQGNIVRGTTGYDIQYDRYGRRAVVLSDHPEAGGAAAPRKETYTYDPIHTVREAFVTNLTTGAVRRTLRANDALGRAENYWEFAPNSNTVTRHVQTVYDADNMPTKETTQDPLAAPQVTDYTYAGNGILVSTRGSNSANETTVTINYKYEKWDSYKESTVTITAHAPNINGWQSGTSRYFYNSNGHIRRVEDAQASRTLDYTNNHQGQVLKRFEVGSANPTSPVKRHFYSLNGIVIGDVGTDHVPSRVDYAQALADYDRRAIQGYVDRNGNLRYTGFTVNDNGEVEYQYENVTETLSRQRDVAQRVFPVTSADFDQNYQPINDTYPARAASSYVTRNGDNLRSIALSMWGDASLWYLLADANGLTGSEQLPAGTRLTIPNVVTNVHNSSETFRPYDAGLALGDTTPTLPDPPPPPRKKGGCGGFGQILLIVVIIVATIYTAGAAAAFLSSGAAAGGFAGGLAVLGGTATGIGAMGTIAAAAIGGAVGSIVGQGIMMATGHQDKFSWKQVAMSAVGSGVTAGVGSWLNPTGAAVSGWQAAGQAALANAATQGVNMALGLQNKFSWRSVAASAAGAAAGRALGQAWGQPATQTAAFFQNSAQRFGGGVLTARLAGDDKPNFAAIAGSAVGSSLVDELGWEVHEQDDRDRMGRMPRQDVESSLSVPERDDAELGTAMRVALFRSYRITDSGATIRRVEEILNQSLRHLRHLEEDGKLDLGVKLKLGRSPFGEQDFQVAWSSQETVIAGLQLSENVHGRALHKTIGDEFSTDAFRLVSGTVQQAIDAPGLQAGEFGFIHSTTPALEHEAVFKAQRAQWVDHHQQRAQEAMYRGDTEAALIHFGLAGHTVQDATSPQHGTDGGGMKVWTGEETLPEKLWHVRKELRHSYDPDSYLMRGTAAIYQDFFKGTGRRASEVFEWLRPDPAQSMRPTMRLEPLPPNVG